MSRETFATPGFGPAVYDTPSGAFADSGSFARVIMRASGAALIRAGDMCAGAFATIRRYQVCRRAVSELAQLDDHMLRDIGISRSEIHRVVYGLDNAGRNEKGRWKV